MENATSTLLVFASGAIVLAVPYRGMVNAFVGKIYNSVMLTSRVRVKTFRSVVDA